jgi:hypothetical protein
MFCSIATGRLNLESFVEGVGYCEFNFMLFRRKNNGLCTQMPSINQIWIWLLLPYADCHVNFSVQTAVMGNDGGSIPTRRELVKEAAKALTTTQIKEVQQESQEHAWNHDPLSRKPLSLPVVSDCAGILYNKDSIIEFLLAEEKDAEQEKVLDGRVKALKDVVEVRFEVQEGEAESFGTGARRAKWVCPITREEMGPQAKAVYLVPCGHAFAGSVVREVSERICTQVSQIQGL